MPEAALAVAPRDRQQTHAQTIDQLVARGEATHHEASALRKMFGVRQLAIQARGQHGAAEVLAFAPVEVQVFTIITRMSAAGVIITIKDPDLSLWVEVDL